MSMGVVYYRSLARAARPEQNGTEMHWWCAGDRTANGRACIPFRRNGTNGNVTVFMAPTVCSIMCATVQSRAARAATLSTVKRKRSSFEAKTPHLALEGVESSLLEV